jgi:tetratricopeptide (TPR) repeat protein
MERFPMLRHLLNAIFLAILLCWACCLAQAQPSQEQNQQQSPPTAPSGSSAPQKKPPATAPAADIHNYDAYNAERDVEVATFYIHKGDIDAAIPRLEEASTLRPNYGKPRLLLADCYEKKHDSASAVKYYKEYLKVYPNAPDAKKIQKKIEKLESR